MGLFLPSMYLDASSFHLSFVGLWLLLSMGQVSAKSKVSIMETQWKIDNMLFKGLMNWPD